jgi:hypothetical protein
MLITPPGPVTGLVISVASNTTLSILPGNALDSFGTTLLNLPYFLTLNSGTTGVNGIDTGSVAPSTFYGIYAIGTTANPATIGSIMSTSFLFPTMPSGYNIYRRIGYALTNSASHFVAFVCTPTPSSKIYIYPSPVSVLSAGTGTSYTQIDLTGKVPALISIPVLFNSSYTANANGNYFSLIADITATTIPSFISDSANEPLVSQVSLNAALIMGAPSIYYLVQTSDSLDLSLVSFEDYLN